MKGITRIFRHAYISHPRTTLYIVSCACAKGSRNINCEVYRFLLRLALHNAYKNIVAGLFAFFPRCSALFLPRAEENNKNRDEAKTNGRAWRKAVTYRAIIKCLSLFVHRQIMLRFFCKLSPRPLLWLGIILYIVKYLHVSTAWDWNECVVF